jgi:cysteine desulfuration protein SufE
MAPGVFFCARMPHFRPMSIETAAAEIREEFTWLDDWEARYAHIIDLGKANPGLTEAEKTDETIVRGCASQVWMVSDVSEGRLFVRAESDAMIVSGLIAVLIRLYSGAELPEVGAFDAKGFLDEIGVTGALTAQRSNGLASMLERIQNDARQALAA